jgi:uncharacterized protein (DUF433 family)
VSNVIAAFSEEHAERLTGVSKGQLRYWDRTDFFSPTFGGEEWDSSIGRVYSFRDIASLRVLNMLRNDHHVPLGHLRGVAEKLAENPEDRWTGVRLFVFDKRVAWIEPGGSRPQEVLSGQYIVAEVLIDTILADLKSEMQALNTRPSTDIGRIEKVRAINHNAAVVAGTRIRVRDIMSFQRAGYTLAQIREEYPDLTEEDILAALDYGGIRAAA